MRILVLDPILQFGLPLAQRLRHEGHKVVYAPVWGPAGDSPYRSLLGAGLRVRRAPDDWHAALRGVDVATVTGVEHGGSYVKALRRMGIPVCAPGPDAVATEVSRKAGRDAFRRMGLRPTPAKSFDSFAEAAAFLKKNPARYVLKVDQNARAVTETIVGVDARGKDLLDVVSRLQGQYAYMEGFLRVHLERFTPGTEVGFGGWFNGKKLMGPLLRTYEGDGGYAYDLRSPVPEGWVDPRRLEAVLAEIGYRGSFDVNGILDEAGEYRPIEWTSRWGGGTTEFFCHAPDDLGELLYAAATGGTVNPVRAAIRDKLTVLVNLRDEGDMTAPREIVGAEAPYVFGDTAAFVSLWPGRTRAGSWLSLPVHGTAERRVGSYVGTGSSLADALREIRNLSGQVDIAGTSFELGRTREDLARKIPGESREERSVAAYEEVRSSSPHLFHGDGSLW